MPNIRLVSKPIWPSGKGTMASKQKDLVPFGFGSPVSSKVVVYGVGKDGVGISTAVGSSLHALTLRTSWQDNATIVSSSRSGESSLAQDPERPSLYC